MSSASAAPYFSTLTDCITCDMHACSDTTPELHSLASFSVTCCHTDIIPATFAVVSMQTWLANIFLNKPLQVRGSAGYRQLQLQQECRLCGQHTRARRSSPTTHAHYRMCDPGVTCEENRLLPHEWACIKHVWFFWADSGRSPAVYTDHWPNGECVTL